MSEKLDLVRVITLTIDKVLDHIEYPRTKKNKFLIAAILISVASRFVRTADPEDQKKLDGFYNSLSYGTMEQYDEAIDLLSSYTPDKVEDSKIILS